MRPEDLERVLREGPPDEPRYRPLPLHLMQARARAPKRPLVSTLGELAAIAVLVALALVFASFSPRGGQVAGPGDGSAGPSPSPFTSPTTSPSPDPSAGPGTRPAQIVAISDDARLVLLDAVTGVEIRVLVDLSGQVLPEREFPLEALALSPDGTEVYYTQVRQDVADSHVVMRVSVLGGAPEVVIDPGAAPSVSPDGRTLAFSFPADGNLGHNAIGVLDLETGAVREWRLDADEDDFFQVGGYIHSTSWAPEGGRIAYHFDYEGSELRVLDTGQTSLSRNRQTPGNYAHPSWVSGSQLAVVHSCCFHEFKEEPGRAVVVDVDSGEVVREIASGDKVEWLDADASGAAFLVVLGDGTIQVGTLGGQPEPLASGYRAAVW